MTVIDFTNTKYKDGMMPLSGVDIDDDDDYSHLLENLHKNTIN